jgi:hypothetical protein
MMRVGRRALGMLGFRCRCERGISLVWGAGVSSTGDEACLGLAGLFHVVAHTTYQLPPVVIFYGAP